MNDARKADRIYEPKSLGLKIEDRKYKVHNISCYGLAFFSQEPLPFRVGGLIPVSLEFYGITKTIKGELIHVSTVSELRSNIPTGKDFYLCGVRFVFKNKDSQESVKQFVDTQLQE